MKKKNILISISCLLSAIVLMMSYKKSMLQAENQVFLSEVCSKNDRIIYNKEGYFNDYIELYNPTSFSIDISGYRLSDKKDFENAYTIEEGLIEAGCYKVIFPIGFAISDFETIYLSDDRGQLLDKVKVPALTEDISFAKDFSKNQWKIMRATPEKENKSEEVQAEVIISQPKFSIQSGFYDEPFYLEITAPPECKVYYTIDGKEPTAESILYESPIYMEDISYKDNLYASGDDFSTVEYYIPYYPVLKENVIRAVAIDKQGNKSEEIIGNYFVGLEEKSGLDDIHVLSIVTDPQNLFGFEKGIYVKGKVWAANWDEERAKESTSYRKNAKANYTREGKGWRREAYLQVFGKNRQLAYEQQIEMGIHGGWSVRHNQKSFNLYALPSKDSKQYLCEGLLGNVETTLMLRAGGYRDTFATKIREVLNHQLVKDRSLGILETIPCQLFLNGEYWGLYVFSERIDGSYIENNYGVPKENVIILKNGNVVEGEETDNQSYISILEYAKNNDLSNTENYERMKEYIDIQSYIDYYCFQIYVANSDSISNNYALWRTKKIENKEYCDGRWRWILYDTDDSTGMIDSDGLTAAETNTFVEGYWDISPMEDILFSALFENKEFREQFSSTFIEMANTNFSPRRVNQMIDDLVKAYGEGTVLSHQRYVDGNYTKEQYLHEIEILRDFFNKRPNYIIQYMYDVLEKYE